MGKKVHIGEIEIELPDPPKDKTQIFNYGLPKKEQKWKRTEVPKHLFSPKEGYVYTEEDREFIKQEWRRCKEGIWFYNNGNIEYMTGHHYFYCNYWIIDAGYPFWSDADRDFFIFFWYCENHPECLGMLFIANRRTGKTYKSASIAYLRTIFQKNSHAGILSKNSGDAKKIFQKLILSWKKLPEFFRPTDAGVRSPKTVLEFTEPSTKQSKGQKKVYKNVLDSWIDYGSSVETHYDGTKLQTFYLDEFGKAIEYNVHECWYITSECLLVGKNVVGKAILTTTVEELEKKGGYNAQLLWDESDPNKIQANGRTMTGLYRYFKEAYIGLEGFIDDYGYSKKEEALEYIERNRSSKTGEALASEIRKHPIEIHEAFLIDKGSVFDMNKINQQLRYNKENVSEVVRGNLIWTEVDKSVRWMPQENGKFLVYKLPDPDLVNNIKYRSGKPSPGNANIYVGGCDPFDQSKVFHNHMSEAAAYGFRLHDPFNEINTNCFIVEYVARPPKASIFFEDMIMMCVFYGMEMLVERNRPGLIEYFTQRGFDNYLMIKPGSNPNSKQIERGIAMTSQANRDALVRSIQTYIYDYVGFVEERNQMGNCNFQDLLDDWRNFDVDNWTRYDRTVASGLTLLAADKNFTKLTKEKKKNYIRVRRYKK